MDNFLDLIKYKILYFIKYSNNMDLNINQDTNSNVIIDTNIIIPIKPTRDIEYTQPHPFIPNYLNDENSNNINNTNLKFNNTNLTFNVNTTLYNALNINPIFWIDSSDLTSLLRDSNNNIYKILDKSDNENHLSQPTLIKQPKYHNGGILFNANQYFVGNNNLNISMTNMSIIIVLKQYNTSTLQGIISGVSSNTSDDNQTPNAWSFNGTDTSTYQYAFCTNSQTLIKSTTISNKLGYGTYEIIITNSIGKLYYNGTLINTTTFTSLGSFTNMIVGSRYLSNTYSNFFNGEIYEIIVYNSGLSNSDRQSVQSYLSNKWSTSQISRTIPLSNVYTWLDASSINNFTLDENNNVLSWNDKNFIRNFSQSNASYYPIFDTNKVIFNNSYLTFQESTGLNLNNFSIFIVFEEISHLDNAGIISAINSGSQTDSVISNGFSLSTPITGNIKLQINSNNINYTSGSLLTKKLYEFTVISNVGSLSVNGVLQSTYNFGSLGSSLKFAIGGRIISGAINTSYLLNANIYELIILNNAITYDVKSQIYSYLNEKWNIPVINSKPSTSPDVWFDSTQNVTVSGNNVTGWTDLSSNGYSVSINGTAPKRQVVNSLNGIYFNNSNMNVTLNNLKQTNLTLYLIFSVSSYNSSTNARIISFKNGGNDTSSDVFNINTSMNNGVIRYQSSNTYYLTCLYTDTLYIFSMKIKYNNISLYLNNNLITTFTNPGYYNYATLDIGSLNSSVLNPFIGYMNELIIYKSCLPDNSYNGVMKYLSKKWNINIQSSLINEFIFRSPKTTQYAQLKYMFKDTSYLTISDSVDKSSKINLNIPISIDNSKTNELILSDNIIIPSIDKNTTYNVNAMDTNKTFNNFCVAVGGTTNAIIYSSNGINWSASTDGILSNLELSGVAWNGLYWLAVGNGTILSSSNGINWTLNNNSIFDSMANCVACNNTMWVVGGRGTNKIAYSYDTVTWNASSSGNSIFSEVVTISTYNNLWVCGGFNGSSSNSLGYSYNGIDWIGLGSSIFPYVCFKIACNGVIWIATGSSGGGSPIALIAYSYDGINWNDTGSTALGSGYGRSVACNGVMWVICGQSDTKIIYSYDGLIWYPSVNGNSLIGEPHDICWNGNLWIVTGYSGGVNNTIGYSSDGMNWTIASTANGIFGTGLGIASKNVLPIYGLPNITLPSTLNDNDYYAFINSGKYNFYIKGPNNLCKLITKSEFYPINVSGLKMWYDASDPYNTGNPPAIGTVISTWVDKSNNGYNTLSSNNDVTLENDGKYYLNFMTSSYFITPSMNWIINSYYTIFFVETYTKTPYSGRNGVLIGGSGLIRYDGQKTQMNFGLQGNPSLNIYNLPLEISTKIWSFTFTSSPSAYRQSAYLNGNFLTANNASGYVGGGPNCIGSPDGSGGNQIYNNYVGKMREILAYRSDMTTSDRQKVEGYLAWKWGLQSSLPTSHPYYLNKPTNTSNFTPTSISNLGVWYDASDPLNNGGTSFPTPGNPISVWNDKSGNGRDLTQTPTSLFNGNAHPNVNTTPLFTTNVLNGLPVIDFTNSVNAGLYSASNFPITINFTVFLIMTPNTNNNVSDNAQFFAHWSNSPDNCLNMRKVGSYIEVTTFPEFPYAQLIQYTPNTPSLITYTYNNGQMYMQQINSSGVTSGSVTKNQFIDNGQLCNIFVGHDGGNGGTLAKYGEILYYQQSLNQYQIQQVQGYLAWKWGLQTYLPTSHTYYLNPPTSQSDNTIYFTSFSNNYNTTLIPYGISCDLNKYNNVDDNNFTVYLNGWSNLLSYITKLYIFDTSNNLIATTNSIYHGITYQADFSISLPVGTYTFKVSDMSVYPGNIVSAIIPTSVNIVFIYASLDHYNDGSNTYTITLNNWSANIYPDINTLDVWVTNKSDYSNSSYLLTTGTITRPAPYTATFTYPFSNGYFYLSIKIPNTLLNLEITSPIVITTNPELNFTLKNPIHTNSMQNFCIFGGIDTNNIWSYTAYSYNGVDFVILNQHNTLGECRISGLAYNGSMWVLGVGVGSVKYNSLFYSYDGVTWTPSLNGTSIMTNVKNISTNGLMWIACGYGINQVAYSFDGITWYGLGNNFYTYWANCSKWNGTSWLLGGEGGNNIYQSNDGINWTSSTIPSVPNVIIWKNSKWYIGGDYPYSIITSPDGINWTLSSSANNVFTGDQVRAMAVNSIMIVASINLTLGYGYTSIVPNIVSGLKVFHDAADPLNTGSTPTTGTTVSTWYDKSGNNSDTTGGSGDITFQNDGKPYLQFSNSSGSYYSVPEMTWMYNNYFTIFTIEDPSNVSNRRILGSAQDTGNYQYGNFIYKYNNNIEFQAGPTYYRIENQGVQFLTNVKRMMCYSMKSSPSAYYQELYLNGTSIKTRADLNNFLQQLAVANIGRVNNSTDYYMGKMREILCYQGSMSTNDRQTVEGYLAWKWGLQASLPVNHPYYSIQPTINSVTWNTASSGNGLIYPTSMIWNGKYFICSGGGSFNSIYSSSGTNWTQTNTSGYPFPSNYLSEINSSSSLYTDNDTYYQSISVTLTNWIDGQNFSVIGGTSANKYISYSPNGINWIDSTSGNNIFSGGTVYSIGFNGYQWLAGGTSSSNRIAYSSDGIIWTASSSGNSIFTTNCTCFAWSGTLWIAGGSGTHQLASSPDGITWTGIGNSFFSSGCNSILYNGSLWVAGGSSGSGAIIIYSTNGTSWNTGLGSGNSILNVKCASIAWNGSNLFVAGGESTKQLAFSSNGISWSSAITGSILFGNRCRCVAYGNGIWVAGGGTSASLAYSTDGKNWTVSTSGSALISDCYCVSWNNSYWLATGNGVMALSYNGMDWTNVGSTLLTPYSLTSRYNKSLPYTGLNPFTSNIQNLYLIGFSNDSYSDPVNLASTPTTSIQNNFENYQISFKYNFDISRDYYLSVCDTVDGSGVFNTPLTNYLPKLVVSGSITPTFGLFNTNNVFTVTLTNPEYYNLGVYKSTWYIFRADNNTGSNTTLVTSSTINISQEISFTYNPGSSSTTQYFYICSTNVFASPISVLINTGVTFRQFLLIRTLNTLNISSDNNKTIVLPSDWSSSLNINKLYIFDTYTSELLTETNNIYYDEITENYKAEFTYLFPISQNYITLNNEEDMSGIINLEILEPIIEEPRLNLHLDPINPEYTIYYNQYKTISWNLSTTLNDYNINITDYYTTLYIYSGETNTNLTSLGTIPLLNNFDNIITFSFKNIFKHDLYFYISYTENIDLSQCYISEKYTFEN